MSHYYAISQEVIIWNNLSIIKCYYTTSLESFHDYVIITVIIIMEIPWLCLSHYHHYYHDGCLSLWGEQKGKCWGTSMGEGVVLMGKGEERGGKGEDTHDSDVRLQPIVPVSNSSSDCIAVIRLHISWTAVPPPAWEADSIAQYTAWRLHQLPTLVTVPTAK